jgi:ubiquinone/menaquinone biosynthesis C-methylase UbiE
MDKTLKTIETYDLCAAAFEQKFMDLKLYKDKLNLFCSLLDPGDKVLDLGCGPGNVAKLLVEKGFSVVGVDLSSEMTRIAKENVPAAEFIVSDLRNLRMEEQHYKAIIASFCLVHLNNEETGDLLKNIGIMLKQDGLLYLSCMEGEKSGYETTSFSSGHAIFFNYYTEQFLKELLAANHFVVRHTFKQDYLEDDGTITVELIFIAQKLG